MSSASRRRPAAVRRSIAQGIERGVISFRDIAAFRPVDWREFHKGRSQSIDEHAVPHKLGKQRVEQLWSVLFEFEFVPERSGALQSVAQLGEVAGTSAAGSKPRNGSSEIRQRLERASNPFAPNRVFVKPFHKGEPLLDRLPVGERRADVLGE